MDPWDEAVACSEKESYFGIFRVYPENRKRDMFYTVATVIKGIYRRQKKVTFFYANCKKRGYVNFT
ncbi:Uncharacterised protein [Yersinia intermedia]|nr:Uncharacterised protein [Yersinia intermedia]